MQKGLVQDGEEMKVKLSGDGTLGWKVFACFKFHVDHP